MNERDMLLVITICRLLGKEVTPAAVAIQYRLAQQLIRQFGTTPD